MDRRKFIERSLVSGAAVSGISFLNCSRKDGSPSKVSGELAKRSLGKTGEKLSIIGFGGIMVNDVEQAVANEMVSRAFDRGVNYYDVAPTYGNAQDQLGPALEPYRKRCFLACKTTRRKRPEAEKEFHESLNKLRTDYFDLYQLHALKTIEDVETAFAADGAMEVFVQAKKEGKIRFLGFSAHSEEAAILAMKYFDFDTVLFPINFVCWYQGNFGPGVLAKARDKKMGILALKGLALERIPRGQERPYPKCWYTPIDDPKTADLSLRFTLSQGTTAAIPPGEPHFFGPALEIAENYTPVSESEMEQLQETSKSFKPIFKNTEKEVLS